MITLDQFVDLPGFFRVEKGSRAVGPMRSVAVYMVGADPLDENGDHSGRCEWGEGASVEGALHDWWEKNKGKDPLGRAEKYGAKRARELHRGSPRKG